MPRRPSRKSILAAADSIGPGDGDDPRFDRPDDPARGDGGRKTLQLCGQVARALAGVLPTLGDPLLSDLAVSSVVPARGKGRLLVTLTPAPSAEAHPEDARAGRLAAAAAMLRTEVAAAITRRKAPELVFRLA